MRQGWHNLIALPVESPIYKPLRIIDPVLQPPEPIVVQQPIYDAPIYKPIKIIDPVLQPPEPADSAPGDKNSGKTIKTITDTINNLVNIKSDKNLTTEQIKVKDTNELYISSGVGIIGIIALFLLK